MREWVTNKYKIGKMGVFEWEDLGTVIDELGR